MSPCQQSKDIMEETMLSLPLGLLTFHTMAQVMLAVLARGYEWEIDPDEPVKKFPLPVLAWGMPMTFKRLQRPVTTAEE